MMLVQRPKDHASILLAVISILFCQSTRLKAVSTTMITKERVQGHHRIGQTLSRLLSHSSQPHAIRMSLLQACLQSYPPHTVHSPKLILEEETCHFQHILYTLILFAGCAWRWNYSSAMESCSPPDGILKDSPTSYSQHWQTYSIVAGSYCVAFLHNSCCGKGHPKDIA